MPKRHNLFQDLMASIHHQLSAPGQVSESEMLIEMASGHEREVDLVIRTSVAGCDVIISVECIGQQRPASVEWVEQMCGKHSCLPTHRLILISKAGYSKAAQNKAKLMGADAITLDDARQVDWAKYVDRHSRLYFAAIDAITVVIPKSTTYQPTNRYRGVPMTTQFVDVGGNVLATAQEIANAVLSKKQLVAATFGKADLSTKAGWEIDIPINSKVRMHLPDGSVHAIEYLTVAILANPISVCFDLVRASFRDAQIAYGATSIEYGDLLLTVMESKDRKASGELRIRRPWGEVQSYSLSEGEGSPLKIASDDAMRTLLGNWKAIGRDQQTGVDIGTRGSVSTELPSSRQVPKMRVIKRK